MSLADRLAAGITGYSRTAIVVMLLLTVLVGAGAPQVEESSSLSAFQTESTAADKLDYVQTNFSGDSNTTTAQLIVRGDDVLSRSSLLSLIRLEQRLRDNATVNDTLVSGEDAVAGIHDAVATAAIRQEQARRLRGRAQQLEDNRSALASERATLENRTAALNATRADLRAALTRLQRNRSLSVETAFETVRANTTVDLNQTQFGVFRNAARTIRSTANQTRIEAAFRQGTAGVLADEYAAVADRGDALQARGEALSEQAEQLQADRAALENASTPTLAEKRAQLDEMNASAVESVVGQVLDGDSSQLLALMPTDYETGATDADATVLVVTQQTNNPSAVSGSATDRIVDAQLAVQSLTDDAGGLEVLVFGSGIVSHEISASQQDSLTIVGPLALLFVLVTLSIAYRDLLDIVLGLLGIGAVLGWTFGFMGWVGIDFSQVFIAVPVLLIGLSIDYAIHVFMRHREERGNENTASDPRGAMRVAIGGVGIALIYVTATTVIGFLSNLTSPVPPIQEFGVVSAVGIVAALLVFGVLVPALKAELDELLEGYGFDREKRAFGTGGGRFGEALSVGAKGARRAPGVVIALALLLTIVAGAGGAQVSTAFSQEDFLAEEPPDWMESLPEPFAPGEYTVKQNLAVINDRFVRSDSEAQILVEGDAGTAAALQRVADARSTAANQSVTQRLSSGEPALQDPISVMRAVAARNATFNRTFRTADTDGDGVPDENVTAVYDGLFAAAPDQAGRHIQRVDGEVIALRMIVSVEGGAGGDAVTDQMRTVAASATSEGLTATATGQPVLNNIVQSDLLDTVVESLVITLVVVFLFLMIIYRITDGSASLGAVTLLPVAFAVAWILGSMFLLDIPFNAITGLITSLTIGLGVAYTIHLSERYTQELERADTVRGAMRTAVTGTGGALLGSAATTVGGFGVLVFAILPPLQQFGLIAGLSIIYSFFGSVFVLPSLLTVWTRYAGPEWARDQLRSDGDPADLPAGLADGDGPAALREVEFEHVRPGGWVEVTVTVAGVEGRVALRETFGDDVRVRRVEPAPVEVVERDGTIYVAWEATDGPRRLTYEGHVEDAAADGTRLSLDGVVMTAGADHLVEGDAELTVVADLFERVVARGEVTDDDLTAADEYLAAGQLSVDQFERVYRAWLGESVDRPGSGSGSDTGGGREPAGDTTAIEPDGGDRNRSQDREQDRDQNRGA